MKTAVIYSTSTDDTKKSAEILSELIDCDVQLIAIGNAKDTCLLKYNIIVLGCSGYRIQGSFRRYLRRNSKTLFEKVTALYVNSDENSDSFTNLNEVFDRELIESSFVCSNFGCEVSPYIGNFIKRRKFPQKESSRLNSNNIKEFAGEINSLIEKRDG